jgi:flavodoxin
MNTEKSLIIYFSNSGYTKKLAKELSRNINCDIEEIKTPVSYSGFFGYQRAMFHAIFGKAPEIKKLKHNPANYDLVIIGGPLWAGSTSGPVRAFLVEYKNLIRNISFFTTQGGPYGKKQLFLQMEEICGKKPIACLSVTDKSLNENDYQQSVWTFLNELQKNFAKTIGINPPKTEYQIPQKRVTHEQQTLH